MSIEGIVITLLLTTLLLFYVVRPLLRPDDVGRVSISRQRERALLYYERVLTNIRDLDEDRQTGKVDPAEYAQEREFWMARGVQLLRVFDKLDQDESIVGEVKRGQDVDAHIDRAIEDAIQAYQGRKA